MIYIGCSTHLYADPTDEEEALSTGTVTVVVTKDKKLVSVLKPGNIMLLESMLLPVVSEEARGEGVA